MGRLFLFLCAMLAAILSLLLFLSLSGAAEGGATATTAIRPASSLRPRRVASAGQSRSALPHVRQRAQPTSRRSHTLNKGVKRHRLVMRGMTVSCPGWGAIWATRRMYQSMKDLKSLGVNWISYHPYASIRGNGRIDYSVSLRQPTVLNPMYYAKKLGMKILLKPHLGYWGSRFSWRGDITFTKEAQWQRFFRDYTGWIVSQAKMAEAGGAPLFSVGVEYKKTLHRAKEWRAVIRAVRRVYRGKLTYAANWDEYKFVPFWDQLDYIGIQAYFPLTKSIPPTTAQLRAGWKRVLKKVKAFAAKHRKPMLFTELGYNRAAHAAARPWDHSEGGPGAAMVKLRAMDVSLQVLSREPAIHGIFLWKWFPTSWEIASNYTLQYPAMRQVIRRSWMKP